LLRLRLTTVLVPALALRALPPGLAAPGHVQAVRASMVVAAVAVTLQVAADIAAAAAVAASFPARSPAP
jgi:hypothetical protein